MLYGTAKTHKFDDVNDITVESLKFRPIIAQTGTYIYKAAQVISQYLKPLYEMIILSFKTFRTLLN